MTGPGFSFSAPSGWQVRTGASQSTAASGSELVQVTAFPLLKPYTAALFARVATELQTRMLEVARQTRGRLAGTQTVTVAGIRSHAYRVDTGSFVDEYTFVLRGQREFQLLCRRSSSGGDDACRLLASSFRVS